MAERDIFADEHPLLDTDVVISGLKAKPELNGLCGRVVCFDCKQQRYGVRLLSGRLLALKPECLSPVSEDPLEQDPSSWPQSAAYVESAKQKEREDAKKKGKTSTTLRIVKNEDVFEAACAYIQKRPDVRKRLTEQVRQGVRKKGPGALVLSLYKADEIVPTMVQDAEEALEQAKWHSNAEMCQKYGKLWTEAGKTWEHCREGGLPAMNYVDVAKSCAMFLGRVPQEDPDLTLVKQLSILNPSVVPDEFADLLQREQLFADQFYGLYVHEAKAAEELHMDRRKKGEEPPFAPRTETEHHWASVMRAFNRYDEVAAKYGLPPIGDSALWVDHEEMDGYRNALGFLICCMDPVSKQQEEFWKESNAPVIVMDGWLLVGLQTLSLWHPGMDRAAVKGKDMLTEYRADTAHFVEVPEAARAYQGGKFADELPRSTRVKTRECFNPQCDQTEEKVTVVGEGVKREGIRMKACSRCQSVVYCSRACQLEDWDRHKKECKNLQGSGTNK